MDIQTSTIQISAEGGKPMALLVAAPGGDGKKPALLVIMEVFGVNGHIKDVTQRFAGEGYVAAAPDLYYRLLCQASKELIADRKCMTSSGCCQIILKELSPLLLRLLVQ